MKKLSSLTAVFCLLFFAFISCQKEESKSIDPMAIRSQLASIPAPSKEEIMATISGSPLKSGADLKSVTLIQVFQLAMWTFDVNNSYSVKHFVLYETNENGYREKYLTINQRFEIRDGNLDTSSYTLSFDVGCPYSKIFYLENQDNVIQINYFLRFDDGKQFAYFGENNSGQIKLPQVGGAQWQLEVIYDDGDLQQRFSTKMIDFNGDQMLKLDIRLEDENIVSYVEMENALTKGAYLIQLATYSDETGEYNYVNCPVLYNENLQELVYFSAPFDVRIVTICSANGCKEYYTNNMGWSIREGKKVYRLE